MKKFLFFILSLVLLTVGVGGGFALSYYVDDPDSFRSDMADPDTFRTRLLGCIPYASELGLVSGSEDSSAEDNYSDMDGMNDGTWNDDGVMADDWADDDLSGEDWADDDGILPGDDDGM